MRRKNTGKYQNEKSEKFASYTVLFHPILLHLIFRSVRTLLSGTNRGRLSGMAIEKISRRGFVSG
jgi:hypothetical protein